MRAKELRRTLVLPSEPVYHPQTHLVIVGRFKYPAYQDGNVLRSIIDDEVLARKVNTGWSRPVKVAPAKVHAGTDAILPLGPAVEVHLTKGNFY